MEEITKYKFETTDQIQAETWMNANKMSSFIFELKYNMFRWWDEREDIDIHTFDLMLNEINSKINEEGL
ncbi:MAG: hypothetical protein ACOC33_03675 [bacterium]